MESDDNEVYVYTRDNRNEHVPDRVTHVRVRSVDFIRAPSFENHTKLKEVVLWQGLRGISSRVFYGCISLTRVAIPSSVTSIGNHAFNSCESLREVNLTEGLQDIGSFAFYRCHRLGEICIPSTTNAFNAFVFSACSSLVSAKFQEGLMIIGRAAFCRCSSLSTISIPSSVVVIQEQAFSGCSGLLNLELPKNGNLRLTKWAFKDCEKLVNVAIPSSYFQSSREHMTTEAFAGTTFLPNVRIQELNRSREIYSPFASLERLVGIPHLFSGRKFLALLRDRYEELPIHKVCSASSDLVDLQKSLKSSNEGDEILDCFEMTPFHALATSANMRLDYLNALLERYSTDLLVAKDQRGNTMIDYLLMQGPSTALPLLKLALQRTVVDGIKNWGLPAWKSTMMEKVNAFHWDGGIRRRREQFSELQMAFTSCGNVEMTSLLELALWKQKIHDSMDRESSGAKRQKMDRDALRTICGSDVVMGHVSKFLVDPSPQLMPMTSFQLVDGMAWISRL